MNPQLETPNRYIPKDGKGNTNSGARERIIQVTSPIWGYSPV